MFSLTAMFLHQVTEAELGSCPEPRSRPAGIFSVRMGLGEGFGGRLRLGAWLCVHPQSLQAAPGGYISHAPPKLLHCSTTTCTGPPNSMRHR